MTRAFFLLIQVVEFDRPDTLLAIPDSMFSQLMAISKEESDSQEAFRSDAWV